MTLGQRIQELRKQAGLSQEGLGEALGVSRQAVSKWEGDNGIPELDTLIAMSRLFGVTVGQLLGVEEPARTPEKPADPLDEERVEAILHRYAEETRQHEPPKKRGVWLWPLGACCVLLAAVIVLFVQTKQVEENVDNLWENIASINSTVSNVRNQIGGLSGEIRDILVEQSNPLSTFDCQVVGFDAEAQTVDVELTATLKTYTAGETAQFCLSWIKTDQTTGETVTDPVEGPNFKTTVTIPMNFHLEVSVRLTTEDGTIREQDVATIYDGMHEGNFVLRGVNLSSILEIYSGHAHYMESECAISSGSPQLLWPTAAELTVIVNGEVWGQRELSIRKEADHVWRAGDPDGAQELKLEQGDELVLTLRITDNYGREYTTTETHVAVESGLDSSIEVFPD